MKITWIGQSGYMVDLGDMKLIIDPYLSNSLFEMQGLQRLFPIPNTIDQHKIDFVYCTHNHLDHFDPETINLIMRANPKCTIIGPASVIAHAEKIGISKERLITLNWFSVLYMNNFRLTATPAYHSDPFATGIIIETTLRCVYFSGDTEYDTQLLEEIISMTAGKKIDAFFVCINGKLGNMDIVDAVEFGMKIKPKLVIPNHYGLFAENTADPYVFEKGCIENGIAYEIMNVGQYLEV